jgi:peptide/nickel transport system substrate-binding protein
MKRRSRWFSILVSLGVVFSLMSFAVQAPQARASGEKHSAASKANKPCKRNTPVGTIKYSDWEFPATLNVLQTTETVSQETEAGMYDGLFLYNHSGNLIPDVATNIPTTANKEITNGGKTITVHIKKGLRWSNGQPLTSADVKFSWEVDNNKATGPYCLGFGCDQIAKIDTPDKYTVVFHFKSVFAPAVDSAIEGINLIPIKWAGASGGWASGDVAGAAAKMEATTFNFENDTYPTNGPFQVASFTLNDRIILKPMKYYQTLACGAKIAQPLFVFYSSKPGMIAAAAAKQTDITQDYTPADLVTLLQHKNVFTTYNAAGLEWEHFEFNVDPTYNGKPNPVANHNVRLALALALDKQGLIRSALGLNAKQTQQIIGWNMWVNTPKVKQAFVDKSITGQWDPIAKKYTTQTGSGQALADAKTLIKDSPCASGCTLDFATTSGNPVRQAQEAVAAHSWAQLGVQLNPNYVPASKFFGTFPEDGTLSTGSFQIGQYTGNITSIDPSGYNVYLDPNFCDRHAAVHSATNGNNVCEVDPAIHKAFVAGAGTLDPKKRQKEYSFIQETYNKNAWWIVLYYRGDEETSDGVNKAYQTSFVQSYSEWNMYKWTTGKS